MQMINFGLKSGFAKNNPFFLFQLISALLPILKVSQDISNGTYKYKDKHKILDILLNPIIHFKTFVLFLVFIMIISETIYKLSLSTLQWIDIYEFI